MAYFGRNIARLLCENLQWHQCLPDSTDTRTVPPFMTAALTSVHELSVAGRNFSYHIAVVSREPAAENGSDGNLLKRR